MDIALDYYRIFEAVARHRSFTRAAEALVNSQPNLTRAVHNLEAELGCRLFLRSSRGVELTPEVFASRALRPRPRRSECCPAASCITSRIALGFMRAFKSVW